jgi:hypothetical protein
MTSPGMTSPGMIEVTIRINGTNRTLGQCGAYVNIVKAITTVTAQV